MKMKPLHIALWVAGLAAAGYVLYRIFSGTATAAPLTVDTKSASSSPSSSGSGNGSRARVGRRKNRHGGSEEWAPSASEFKTADVIKEADSVVEDDSDDEISESETE